MDKFAERLRDDAERIEVRVSAELDRRIRASLESAASEPRAARPGPARRPLRFWWASSLTGLAAAIAVIAFLNVGAPTPPPSATPVYVIADIPRVDLRTETAALAEPLEQELERLESDFRKARERIREDIGL